MNIDDYNDLDNRLREMELTYEGVDITYLIRNHLISLIRTKQNVGNSEIKLNGRIVLRLLKSVFRTFPNLFSKKSIWVFSNAERRKKIDEYYVDRVASIVGETKESTLFIENPIISDHKFPTRDSILSDAIFFLGSYLFGIFCFKRSKLKIDIEGIRQIVSSYDISENIPVIIKRFIGQYHFMSFFLKFHSSPTQVYVVYPNGYYGYILAFKQRKIPIIELQHGIIYEGHPSYNTTLYAKSKNFKPDFIFTYGTRDTSLLTRLRYVDSNNIHTVGSYGLWLAKNSVLENRYLNNLIDLDKKTIVMIATANDLEIIYELALKLKDDNFNILILPRIMSNIMNREQGIVVIDVDRANVFELYQVADFVITISSTSALESLFMGVPTFVYLYQERSIFLDNYSFVQSLNYFINEKEFFELIKTRTFLSPAEKDVEQIYASDVMGNFIFNSNLI